MKYFIFYLSTGLIASTWYANMMEWNFGVSLGIISVIGAFASLYIGKIKEPKKVLFFGLPISALSIIFLSNPIAQIIYGIVSIINNLAIVMIFSKIEKLGKLNFYAQIAFASTLFIGTLVNSYASIISVSLILLLFIFLNGQKTTSIE